MSQVSAESVLSPQGVTAPAPVLRRRAADVLRDHFARHGHRWILLGITLVGPFCASTASPSRRFGAMRR